MSRLSDAELGLIKDMIDELVVNRGLLDLRTLRVSAHNLDFQRLARIACRYYRVTIEGQMTLDFLDAEKLGNQPAENRRGYGPACSACRGKTDITITRESSYVPLCAQCHQKLDPDLEVLSSLLP